MGYAVKEIFYTLQGEGAHAGRPAVFCRFAGCNLWSGREEDRHSAVCQFCDTDFVLDAASAGKFPSAARLSDRIAQTWGGDKRNRYVVCTGGEPLLQLDAALVDALHQRGFTVAIETNGTMLPPDGIDWICVSPKSGAELALRSGDELKVVYPQIGQDLRELATLNFKHFFIQPMDGERAGENTRLAVEFCMRHPQWRLSLQTHKLLGIP